jgi:cell division septation protein DedD
MNDEEVNGVLLTGKNLVFLVMTSTVVAVVIFLCGVFVGRGVRAQHEAVQPGEIAALPTAVSRTGGPAVTLPDTSGPLSAAGELSYPRRLESESFPTETLAPRASTSEGSEKPTAAPPASQPAESRQSPGEPPGTGYAVQVAALSDRIEAEALVARLAGKGYPAYLLAPAADSPAGIYRVRIGKYKNRREADEVKRRLEREEQFEPWIIR